MRKAQLAPRRHRVHVKKGQEVIVISGVHKNKKGKVLEVLTKKNRVIVEGVNIVTKAVKPNPKNPKGGFVQREAPIHASKVMDVKKYEERFQRKRAAKSK
ncbi:MAG: 50S ribosomal protein L24 [Methylacidiphilales bacterium]|nr:50S ribosomal protein L24 [Candidatus Methylacidiphilales bacterium]MDW8348977.1 50S ribosomal protein L24 [Verrucomicrobiae bacterium]